MYVLTKGWYDAMEPVGIVATEAEARAWYELGDEREWFGPFQPGTPAVSEDDE
jgi:hypothetical protein